MHVAWFASRAAVSLMYVWSCLCCTRAFVRFVHAFCFDVVVLVFCFSVFLSSFCLALCSGLFLWFADCLCFLFVIF